MDEVIWVEVLSRARDVATRQRCSGSVVAIGRAFDNDIVIDDPHVAAHHLRLVRGDDGAWAAQDLGSLNGTFVDGQPLRRDRIVLEPAMTLRLGATLLRVRHAGDAVAAELPLLRIVHRWPLALACLAVAFALVVLDMWLADTGEPKLIRYLSAVLMIAGVVAVWSAAWTMASRVLTGAARYGTHLLIVASGLLAFTVLDQLGDIGAFALSWTALASAGYVLAWTILAAVCFAHLRALGGSRLAVKAAVVIALAALAITVQTLKLSEWRSTYGQATTLQRLQPPWLRIVTPRSEQTFVEESKAIRERLDSARSEEPAAGDAGAGGDD
jgi:hypothetical protein